MLEAGSLYQSLVPIFIYSSLAHACHDEGEDILEMDIVRDIPILILSEPIHQNNKVYYEILVNNVRAWIWGFSDELLLRFRKISD